MRRHRNAKIVATLGPASSDAGVIRRLFEAGADVFRLNASHGTQDDHRARFEIIRALVNEMLTVSDAELIAAMRLCWGYMKIVVEPTAVLSLAGLLSGKLDMRGKRVGVILTGGNVDPAAELL